MGVENCCNAGPLVGSREPSLRRSLVSFLFRKKGEFIDWLCPVGDSLMVAFINGAS